MQEPTKPKYQIPSMNEINQIPYNGYKVVSTFTGCGGGCLGLRMAGFKTLWANEFIRAARDTYEANFPETIMDGRDIRRIKLEDILEKTGLERGQIDLLEGSPPCADFSMAGKRKGGIDTLEMCGWGRKKKYSDTYQQVDDLFYEFARILKELQPRVFIAENVRGLTLGHAAELLGSPQMGLFGQHEGTIYHTLVNCGYNVRYKVLNARHYGVPQNRERLIFIGTRLDLNIEPVYPIPLNYEYCVADALPWIKNLVQVNVFNQGDKITPSSKPSPTLKTEGFGGTASTYIEAEESLLPVELETDISKYAIGREWENIQEGQSSDKYFNLTKPALDKPCPTITQTIGGQTAASVVHPLEKRKFSTAELRRLSSFPDDFVLTGTFQQKCERIGRAVPPLMMYHIAKTIGEEILDKCKI